MFPSIAEYNQTLQQHGGSAFRTLADLKFIPSRQLPVKIYSHGSGSYAVIFKAQDNGKEYAIRCFISAEPENIERYRHIGSYLRQINASWCTNLSLLEHEIAVGGRLYPLVKMDWVSGLLLNNYISTILHNDSALSGLQEEIVRVSKSLEANNVGHGDIQCGNIIIATTNGSITMKLIDYDGMYIPAFAGRKNIERGRAEFQHPLRKNTLYNEQLDRFSFWVLLTALEALRFDKSLWNEIKDGGFNTLDNTLFTAEDFTRFGHTPLTSRLYKLRQPSLQFYLDSMHRLLQSDARFIDTPILYDSSALPITPVRQGASPVAPAEDSIVIHSTPDGAVVLNTVFQRIGTTPLVLSKNQYVGKQLIVSRDNQTHKIQVESYHKVIELTFLPQTHEFPELPSVISSAYAVPPVSGQPVFAPAQPVAQPFDFTNLPPVPVQKRTNDSKPMFIFFGVLVGLVAVLALIVQQQRQAFAADETTTTDTVTTSTLDNNTTVMPMPDTTAFYNDTSIVAPAAERTASKKPEEDAPSNYSFEEAAAIEDDLHATSQATLETFFKRIGESNCEDAFAYSYVPAWEKKGADWFCSSDGFGDVSKIIMYNIVLKSHTADKAWYRVEYYAEDAAYGNYCFEQSICMEMYSFDNVGKRWMLTVMKDVKDPYDCNAGK